MIGSAVYGYTMTSPTAGTYDLQWKGQSSIVGGDINDVTLQITEHDNILRIKVSLMVLLCGINLCVRVTCT